MPPNLPPDFITRVKTVLLPFVATVDDRESLLTEAFYLVDPRPYQQIKVEGAPGNFCVQCIRVLLDIGCLTEQEHGLAALLNTVRHNCGVDKHKELDALVTLANGLCGIERGDEPPPPTPPPTPPARPAQSVDTPLDKRTPTVFVSYSHNDSEFAKKLIADLQRAGHAVWIDVSTLKGGDVWIRAIAEGIINSYAFVVIATKPALESPWVQDEITWAKQRSKRMISVLLEDVVDEVGFFPLVNYQGVKFYDTDYDAALAALLAGLPPPYVPAAATADSGAPVSQRALELQYLDRLRFEILLNTEKYTPLAGESRFRAAGGSIAPVVMRPEYALLSRDKEQPQAVRRFDDAVTEILKLRRAVVLGEPGAGKTTTLWKLARQLVDAALADPQAPIPLVIRLGRWTDDGQPVRAFIARELGELGRYLDDLLRDKRAVLLLDGLNEIPVSQRRRDRSDKDRQVGQLIEQNPDLLAVVSCRAQDYTLDLGFDRIEITPLDSIRIQEFVQHYLGVERGERLFERLIGEQAARTEQEFFDWEAGRIKDPLRVFWLERDLPEGLMWGWKWHKDSNAYWECWLRERENPASLLLLSRNPYMLSMLTQVYAERGELPDNRGELFRDFVLTLLAREKLIELDKLTRRPIMNAEAEALLAGLARLAYEMQVQRGQAEDGNALTVLPLYTAQSFLNQRQLYQAGSASILSVGDTVRFTHQLLQEYFAATHMKAEIKVGRLRARAIWQPENWWERTNWEEAVILLAGLYSDDCAPVLDWTADANPEVAALCIVRSGAKTPDTTKERLRDAWLPRLTAASEPPLARAAVGRALAIAGLDNRKGVGLRADGLPDMDWVDIPAGAFLLGSDKAKDRLARDNETPQRSVTLPAYRISRYPVTYTQFQAFLDAPDGFHSPLWWDGLAADEQHRRAPGEQAFQYANHPRETVNWYDAIAFCRWLSAKLGYEVMLPTEAEWEKAA